MHATDDDIATHHSSGRMYTNKFLALFAWAVLLACIRWNVFGSTETQRTASDDVSVSYESVEGPNTQVGSMHANAVALRAAMHALLEAVTTRSNKVRAAEMAMAAMEDVKQALLSVGTSSQDGGLNAGSADASSQVAHVSDAYFAATKSSVPAFPSDDLFCEQLLNTYPMFFGGDVPVAAVTKWCEPNTDSPTPLLQNLEFADHLPPGVEDRYFIPFTLLQIMRKMYMLELYVDRMTRFRDLLAPMIDAMEGRHDRMLYNYI